MIFITEYNITLEDKNGNTFPDTFRMRMDIADNFPQPPGVERDMLENAQKKDVFQKKFFYECQKRFPPNNIFDIHVSRIKVLSLDTNADGT